MGGTAGFIETSWSYTGNFLKTNKEMFDLTFDLEPSNTLLAQVSVWMDRLQLKSVKDSPLLQPLMYSRMQRTPPTDPSHMSQQGRHSCS